MVVWLCGCLREMEQRSSRRIRRRTSRVCNTKWELLGLLGRVGRRHGRRVGLFGRAFLSSLHRLAWLLHVWLIGYIA